ncbi:phosphate/phosphite/phosphonate ABC transporter substrate-binding protein [Hoeflea prorocentri]|uniref:PhnD/SsuA/transferrin family substrate-binding protein n=1 Tax=Hoeflea prorocentri TaxID=1922333 RepID=A0A9X3UH85_9HYPH|nr:PhnD/SsuA/transferrin family substrate-binding protein [Hoeflea prorocentri]MCY6380798.1 PhnD/SsuA/transferrin family substrate-binding protein [Hoeflea prorocentri]MDA5398598.1 PhnD/SsuA/transferrin family substrate-binding protein [Hoeflea prorocentri]
MPLVSKLRSQVRIVGTPAYDINCGAGCYYSMIIARQDNDAVGLADLRGKRFAYNSEDSFSGYAAPAHHLRQMSMKGPFFGEKLRTGSHRASIRAVTEGKADVAAIDAVSWRLALRHEKSAESARILAITDALPGLPFITAARPQWRVERLHLAVVEAMASLDSESADALLLTGFAQTDEADYASLGERVRLAMAYPI